MVRAILDGRKTQTRRVIKPQPEWESPEPVLDDDDCWVWCEFINDRPVDDGLRCPYGEPGDRLWVKERLEKGGHFESDVPETPNFVLYSADKGIVRDDGPFAARWEWQGDKLPSIFCPRICSRITLEITGVRVERVQDIANPDAEAEGAIPTQFDEYWWDEDPDFRRLYIPAFKRLWDDINAERGYPWASNPYVWVVEFRRLGG